MTGQVAALMGLVAALGSTLLAKLTMAVRPEFSAELIRIDPGNPVFARGRCQVLGCERGAWTRMLCNGHYGRWRTSGRSEMAVFAAITGPLADRSDRIDASDLLGLPLQVRLEIAYSIQCRHDERTVRLIR